MQAQDEGRRGHLRAGIAGRDEGVGASVGLKPDADDHGRLRLASDGDRRLVGHLDDIGRVDDLKTPSRLDQEGRGGGELGDQLLLDDARASHELDLVLRPQFLDGEQGGSDRRGWGKVAPHRVQRDARHGYASRAATRCSPA